MKRLLFSCLLFSGMCSAQVMCPADPCTSYTTFDSTASRHFTGNICLRGDFTIPTSIDSCTLTNYTLASLSHIRWDADFVMTDGQDLIMNHCIITRIPHRGINSIYVIDSAFVVEDIVAIEPGILTVYVNPGGRIWIKDRYYYGGQSYGNTNVVECGQILALRPVVRTPFKPNITYNFIISDFYTARQYRKTCTYQQAVKTLQYETAVIVAGGTAQITKRLK